MDKQSKRNRRKPWYLSTNGKKKRGYRCSPMSNLRNNNKFKTRCITAAVKHENNHTTNRVLRKKTKTKTAL